MTSWLCKVLEEGAAAEARGWEWLAAAPPGAVGLAWMGSGCVVKADGEVRRCRKK